MIFEIESLPLIGSLWFSHIKIDTLNEEIITQISIL